MSEPQILDPITRLNRDLRASVKELSLREVRYIVDLYYQVQDYRIQAAGQVRAAKDGAEPHALSLWAFEQFETIEKNIRSALDLFARAHLPGQWALSIHGIGPVIAAGLLAHIDITKAPTVGHIWRFAGLDPTVKWNKGERRPWNGKLKVLCWKVGQSFMKLRTYENDIYGKVYEERKALELERNAAGQFAPLAAQALTERKIVDKDLKACYESGKLPPGRIEMRAERYATKLFLSHLHHVMYEAHFKTPPPKPYIIEHGGHTHFIAPPHWINGKLALPEKKKKAGRKKTA